MASAAQIAAALADAQAKQALADAAAAAYTAKVAELASLGGSPGERVRAIRDSINSTIYAAIAAFPASVTTDPSRVAADIEQLRAQMVAAKTAFSRYMELSSIRIAYPAQYASYTNEQAVSFCSISYSSLTNSTDQTAAVGLLANARNPTVPADAAELLRLELLAMAGYYGVGYHGTGYCGQFLSVAGAQTANNLEMFVSSTSSLTTAQILDPYYQEKITTTYVATTAWNYYDSLTPDVIILNTRTVEMSGGVTVGAVPTITIYSAVAQDSHNVVLIASGGVTVGGIASAVPYSIGQHVGSRSYAMDGGATIGGTASLPGTTGSGGAVVIVIRGDITAGGGDAGVILADLTTIEVEMSGPGGTGTVDDTIDADLTLISATVLGNGYVVPASDGTIDTDLPLLMSELLSGDYVPPAQVDGTIDDAPLTLIAASIAAETGPVRMIDGDLPLITVSIDALIVPDTVGGTIDAELTLVDSEIEVFDPVIPWIRAKLPRMTSDLVGGQQFIGAQLTMIDAQLTSATGGNAQVSAQFSRMRSSITGNFNLKASLPIPRAQVQAKTGVRAILAATLPSMTAQITKGHSIEATLIPITASLTTAQGARGAITAELPVITPTFTRGTSISSRLPRISADISVWVNAGGFIAAHVPTITSDIDVSDTAEMPSIDASLNTISANIADGAGVSTVAMTLPTITAELTGGVGSVGTIIGMLTSQRMKLTAVQGRTAVCTASIPTIVRGRLQAIRGVRGTVTARLTVSKAALK